MTSYTSYSGRSPWNRWDIARRRCPAVQTRLPPRRATSEPRSAVLSVQVDYPSHARDLRPIHTPNRPLGCRIGQPRRPSTAEQSSGDGAAASRAPSCPAPPDLCWTHEIRSNLPLRPRPLDLDPTDLIGPYRFGLAYFLKSPRLSTDLTRGPNQCESNLILFLKLYTLAPDLLQF